MKQLPLLLLFAIATCFPVYSFAQTETRTRTVGAEQDVANPKDPVAALREQIQAAPDAVERNRLQLQLADLLLSSGNRSEAIAELNTMANSTSLDPVGFYNLGNSFARLGDSDAAIAAYRKAIEQRKGRYSRALNNLGVMLIRSGRWDEAQDALLEALKLEGFRYAEASYNLGRVYSARGQNDLAAREWRRALAVDPSHDAARDALARVKGDETIVVSPSRGNAPVSGPPTPSGTKPFTLGPTSYDFLQRARHAAERGKMAEAVNNLQRLLNREGGYFAPVNLELGLALLSLKRYDDAFATLLEVSQRDGARFPVSYFHLARMYELKGELKLAEAAFAQAAAINTPDNAPFLLDLSRVREKLGDFRGSLEAMERYLNVMQTQGHKPTWSDSRLAELRTKVGTKN